MSRETRRKLKAIDRNTEVIIQNNTHGKFYWESLNHSTVIMLNGQNDEDFIRFGELRMMLSQLRPYLENMRIIISSVEDDDVSVLDVANALHIGKTYSDFFDKIADLDPNEIEMTQDIQSADVESFIMDSDIEDFKKAMQTNLKNILIEGAVFLHKQGELSDYDKMQLVARSISTTDQDSFWQDIDASRVG